MLAGGEKGPYPSDVRSSGHYGLLDGSAYYLQFHSFRGCTGDGFLPVTHDGPRCRSGIGRRRREMPDMAVESMRGNALFPRSRRLAAAGADPHSTPNHGIRHGDGPAYPRAGLVLVSYVIIGDGLVSNGVLRDAN